MRKEQLHTKKNKVFVLSNLPRNKGGFSLIEIIVAFSIFIILVMTIGEVSVSSGWQVKNASNKAKAVFLAEEGLEATRSIRDADFANLTDGTSGISTSGNQWSLSGSSDTTDIFTRVLTISPINTNQKKVEATVSWADQISQNNSVTLKTYLTNWHAPLNVGLTIDKVVINHGGTKTVDDFLPINLTTQIWDNSVEPPELISTDIPIIFAPTTMSLADGTYTFITSSDPDYDLTLSSDCGSGSIVLASGDTKLCSITYEEKVSGCLGTPWGDVLNGYSNTAYQSSSVNYPSTCISETRTCTAGTMSGSYLYTSCVVNPILPTVSTTSPVTTITRTTSTGGGNVTSDGGSSITARGVVWNTSINPTIALSTKTSDGTGTGTFTSSLTSLTCNTLYHVRAYATNSVGTNYGSDVTFTTSACSSITFVGSQVSVGATATIPTHLAGDLLIAFSYRDGNASAPSLASGWTNISNTSGSNANGSRLAYRIATGSDTASGWTSATLTIISVYRGQSINPIGATLDQSGSGTTVTYPALTLQQTNGTSFVLGFAGHRSVNTNLQGPPTGMVNRTTFVNTSSEVAGHDTNGGVSSWSAKNVIVGGTSSGWMTRVLEIKSQ